MSLADFFFGPKCTGCQSRTTNTRDNTPLCEDCALKADMAKEKQVPCPKCQQAMKKDNVEYIIIDRCEKCGGVWLERDELDKIVEEAEASVRRSGPSPATGIMLGMAMGNSMCHSRCH